MAKFDAPQIGDFGGVDSRSNPLNMPANRSLRCRNWVPQQDGHLELRRGYSTITMSSVIASPPIFSMESFNLLDGTAYVVYNQGTSLFRMNVATGLVEPLTVRGAAIAGSGRWSWANFGNKLYGFNGVDKKVLDSTGTLRDIGLQTLTSAQLGVSVVVGTADPTGLPASAIGGSQPGYQFYFALWNPTTGEMGNRTLAGFRVVPTVASDIDITLIPPAAASDSEWVWLVGRTRDGAEVPYVCVDATGNWIFVSGAATTATITASGIDDTRELPTRNVQPQAFVQVKKIGDKLFGVLPNDSRVYSTESQADVERSGQYNYMGLAQTAWPLDNWELFPSGHKVTCLNEYSQNGFVFTVEKCAMLTSLEGVISWQGPWDVGCPGQDAFIACAYGPFWVTGRKELATMGANGPYAISNEYERALLARIGDQFLQFVRINHHVDVAKNIDRLVIDAIDEDVNPFQVIHDFNLRDARSDSGQGYESIYSGPLAPAYTSKTIQDQNGIAHLWAAASNGRFYEIGGASSDAGSTFAADYIALLNAGSQRPGLEYIEWYGDGNVVWSIGKKLSQTTANLVVLGPTEAVPGNDDLGGHTDPSYRVHTGDAELRHTYVRAQLTSNNAGTLDLNNPPHLPLETYGRIYLISPLTTPGIGH